MKKKISRAFKRATNKRSTENIVKALKIMIPDPQVRKESIKFIRAIERPGKARNTSNT